MTDKLSTDEKIVNLLYNYYKRMPTDILVQRLQQAVVEGIDEKSDGCTENNIGKENINIVNSFSKVVPVFYLDYDLAETSMTNDGSTVNIMYRKRYREKNSMGK